jgi:hypothetical protein
LERQPQVSHDSIPDRSRFLLGHLYTTRQQRRMVTGVLRTLEPPDHLVLHVPTEVTDQGIQWEPTSVPMTPSVHRWPSTPIWLLPLTRTDM